MAARHLPTLPLMVAPTPTATSFDDINNIMLLPDASSKRSSMAPHELFPMDYDQCDSIPPVVVDDPDNK